MSSQILILGAKGQLGHALQAIEPVGTPVVYADIEECDLTSATAVSDFITEIDPVYIINCAAYTAVDKAEEDAELAHRINCAAVQHIADSCGAARKLVHISTDFVFDGTKRTPYRPEDKPAPLGVYGATKLAGEQAALNTIPAQVMIIRTAWLYYTIGANFVKTMLQLMAERDALTVVNDQRGSPTFAGGLAEVIWQIIKRDCFSPGIYHWTDAGEITWFDFALAIQQDGFDKGLLSKKIPVDPVTSAEYPTAARRPSYSVLETAKLEDLTNCRARPWRDNLNIMLNQLSD